MGKRKGYLESSSLEAVIGDSEKEFSSRWIAVRKGRAPAHWDPIGPGVSELSGLRGP